MMSRLVALLAVFVSVSSFSQEIKITTWNIEHLGSSGRGFGGGFGGGSLPMRTDAQLQKIGDFIKDDLQSDVIAVQEIAKTGATNRSNELDTITAHMGPEWHYYLAEDPAQSDMVSGFIWDSTKVTVLEGMTLTMPNIELAGKNIFDRAPVALYFETIEMGETDRNDIVLINVHLGSGQGNDESHAIAMIALEHALTRVLSDHEVKDSDRVILGDFNDNPHNTSHINTLYQHMERKGYSDLVPASLGFTRMNTNLTSLIDHILANTSALRDITSTEATMFTPGDSSTFADWRETFSDHFPLSIMLDIKRDTDVDFDD